MSSSNNRTINGYETIDGGLVLSEITNSVLATDSDGLVYGINNYISNLTSDVQSQINTINIGLLQNFPPFSRNFQNFLWRKFWNFPW